MYNNYFRNFWLFRIHFGKLCTKFSWPLIHPFSSLCRRKRKINQEPKLIDTQGSRYPNAFSPFLQHSCNRPPTLPYIPNTPSSLHKTLIAFPHNVDVVPLSAVVVEQRRTQRSSHSQRIMQRRAIRHPKLLRIRPRKEGQNFEEQPPQFRVACTGGAGAAPHAAENGRRGEDLVRDVEGDEGGFARQVRVGEDGARGFGVDVDVELGVGRRVAEALPCLVQEEMHGRVVEVVGVGEKPQSAELRCYFGKRELAVVGEAGWE